MLILHAISRARRFIYCEDQYLFASEMQHLPNLSEFLSKRIAVTPGLRFVALTSRTEEVEEEVRQARVHRRRFIERIRAGNPGKISVFQYSKAPHPYVHSKCWIIDDELAIVGSANCNRRSYSHDSEVSAGIVGTNSTGRTFAHDLRIQLWLRHLNPGGGGPATFKVEDVEAFDDGLKLFGAPGSRLEPYDETIGLDDSGAGDPSGRDHHAPWRCGMGCD